ncbi:PDZ domain-containing protein [Leucobacter sp. HNU]|uniref:YlbL family protein n=1 Tax=Leucobacter sp. HNU TaxID=3236805 RepID=UPI003A7F7881
MPADTPSTSARRSGVRTGSLVFVDTDLRGPEAGRGGRSLFIIVAIAAILVLLASAIPSPYAIERPGPVVDTLGTVEGGGTGTPLITIEGERTYPTSGTLNLLTVTMVGTPQKPNSWLSLLPALLDPNQELVPMEEIYPKGITEKQRDEANAALMTSSQDLATVAALNALGRKVPAELVVGQVVDGGPSDGILQDGDVIRSIDARPVTSLTELRDGLRRADGAVTLVIDRGGASKTVRVTPRTAEAGSAPQLGILAGSRFDIPVKVRVEVEGIGGPSAGTIFALAIYDKLTPGDLTGGLRVSGTGTIDASGEVGAIGGLPQKLAGAERAGTDVFFFPVANCADVPSSLPKNLRVVPVSTFAEALEAVQDAAAGKPTPTVSQRCGVPGG